MANTELFAGIPVAGYPAMLAWYERLFGTAPDFFPHDREAVWKVVEHGWVYVVEDAERAGKALVTILVDDLEAQVRQLAERGLPTGPIETMPEGVRVVQIADPEGNRIQLGQPPAADDGSA
jgi:predicted enzyme related to lactoylglutathione lyase